MQLEAKALKLYNTIVIDFDLVVQGLPEIVSLAFYIQKWQQALWEIYFFHEFKLRDVVCRSKS
jgi:hypothetical protein